MFPVYREYFGLVREPFTVTPDPSFLYLSASHKEALAQLVYGVKARRGFVVLTGEVGTGKTTLIHALLQELDDGHTHRAFLFNLIGNQKDLLRSICEDLAMTPPAEKQRELHDYLTLLNQFLLESYRKGDNVAVIIDEAQNLSAEVLESVRLLSNFETSQDKLLQILLVGQPELGARLNAPELRQLKQRVALRHHLSPLNLAECREYVARRLEIAGGNASLFAPKAVEAVYAYSGGIPRLINILCDNGLLTAYALCKKGVEVAMIGEIAQDLHLAVGPSKKVVAREETVVMKTKEIPLRALKEGSFQFIDLVDVERTAGPIAKQASPKIETRAEPRLGQDLKKTDRVFLRQNGPEVPAAPSAELGPDTVPSRFFEHMISALTEAMGPMASLVVHDQVAAMGESSEAFPKQRLGQLVDVTSNEILNKTLRARFQRRMLEEIKTINPPKEEK